MSDTAPHVFTRTTVGSAVADTENRLAALAVTARPGNTGRCTAEADVTAGGVLVCDLPAGHHGWLHHDSADGVWWTRDAEAGRG